MSQTRPPEPGAPQEPLSFEQAVQQLETIIERIESGEVGLEQAIAEYERGVALIRRCRQVLDRAEQRVEDLTTQMQAGGQGPAARPPAPPPPPETPF